MKTTKEREQEIAKALAALIDNRVEEAKMIAWYVAEAERLSMLGLNAESWKKLRTGFVFLMIAGLQEPEIEKFFSQIQLNGRPLN